MSLFGGTYARGSAAAEVDDRAWLRALLEVEVALARASAAEGEIPSAAATRIAAVADPRAFDVDVLARDAADHATVVIPLVRALRERAGAGVAAFVHHGATSQDVLDTATMLVTRRAIRAVLDDLRAAADAAARLADAHRATPMVGRTLLTAALPTSFGLRAAGWLVGLDDASRELAAVDRRALAVQAGGPVGTRAPTIGARLARDLDLAEPTLPWHAVRVPIGVTAGALGVTAGVLAKIARDTTLLGQGDVGEVREGGAPGRGGSSSMKHKRNPVAAVSVLACTTRVPGLVATLLAAMEQELERATGRWQAEWGTLCDLLALTGSAAAWARDLLEGLEVDAGRMRQNLERLAAAGVREAEHPDAALGSADAWIDRALRAHREGGDA